MMLAITDCGAASPLPSKERVSSRKCLQGFASCRISAAVGAFLESLFCISSAHVRRMFPAVFLSIPEQSHKRRDCAGSRVRFSSVQVLSGEPCAAHSLFEGSDDMSKRAF